MPRDANGAFYYPPGTQAEPFAVANSSDVNSRFDAIKDDLNGGPVSAPRLTGTIADARLPATLLRTVTAGDGLTGGGTMTSTIALAVNSSVVRTGRQIIAGIGITGGGDLSDNRTLAFDTTWGDGRYALRGRSVTAGDGLSGGGDLSANRSLAVDGTVVRTARNITTGIGLNGGGNLGADRTINFDTTWGDGRYALRGRIITAGDGLNGGGDLSANRTVAVDGTVVRTSRAILAGSGLTGGGNLEADRTIALGTPGSITATSTNSASATSHTHAISEATVRTLIAKGSAGALGTFGMFVRDSGNASDILPGQIQPGSVLQYTSAAGASTGNRPAGSWMALGMILAGATAAEARTTLFMRVS